MRVFCMGVFRVVVIVVVMMIMTVIMVVMMPVIVGVIVRMAVTMVMIMGVVMIVVVVMVVIHVQPAGPGAEMITERTGVHGRPRRIGPLPFHMMVVAFLHRAQLAFKAQHFDAIFAHHAGGRRRVGEGRMFGAVLGGNRRHFRVVQRKDLIAIAAGAAIGRRHRTHLFGDPLGEGFQHLLVIVQVTRFDKLDLRVTLCHQIGEAIDPVDQDAGEQEIGEDDMTRLYPSLATCSRQGSTSGKVTPE